MKHENIIATLFSCLIETSISNENLQNASSDISAIKLFGKKKKICLYTDAQTNERNYVSIGDANYLRYSPNWILNEGKTLGFRQSHETE